MANGCIFCEIVAKDAPASFVREDALTVAFIDTRQFHLGHILVVPKAHLADIRELDGETGAALMAAVVDVTRAVSSALSCQGISVWNSNGEAAGQEVPHLHFHVHPRWQSDRLLEVYPSPPGSPDRATLDALAASIRPHLLSGSAA
ncbi:HIT family protein [Luteimonas terricola]|uniref:HIT family protein n=1 Tax=Luteimonas terricola TaxID=645597 RepID=A0ABQ2ENK2_9GAMM|nr:HIT family protein [Luteimonas terricola]